MKRLAQQASAVLDLQLRAALADDANMNSLNSVAGGSGSGSGSYEFVPGYSILT